MVSESANLYREFNPAKKNAEWINLELVNIRRNWRQMFDPYKIEHNKRLLFSMQSMDKQKAQYKDKHFLENTEWKPLPMWNNIVNNLVEDAIGRPPKIEVKSNDVTAISDKAADIRRLKYKAQHENNINQLNQKVGLPPIKIGNELFKSNIDEFERLQLDPNDSEDVEFFERSGYQRLKYEIAGQKLLNIIMKLNKFDEEMIRDFTLDILSSLCVCFQTYVDELTGEIIYRRIYPEEAYTIRGDKRDGSNDVADGFIKNLTIREFLGVVGNHFDYQKDWLHLLWAINYANKTKFTGFLRNNTIYSIYDLPNTTEILEGMGMKDNNERLDLEWNLAYQYKILTGYAEWASIDATATYIKKADTGEILATQIGYDDFLEKSKETKEYTSESWYQEQMYKSYFICTSSTSQWIYNWGKVYYQQLHGAFDQYAKGTLYFYQLEGIPPVELTEYYIDFANTVAYKLKWLVYHAKPMMEEYLMEELVSVSKAMQRQYKQNSPNSNVTPDFSNILNDLVKYTRENSIRIRSYPQINGQTVQNLLPLHSASSASTDPLSAWLQSIEEWCEAKIRDAAGLNDLRMGQQENARQSVEASRTETQASYRTTGYLYRTIQYAKEHAGKITLNYAQDIVRFEDSIPYKYLRTLLGEDNFENLKLLKDFASHRMALTVENYNAQMERDLFLQMVRQMIDTGDGRGGLSPTEIGFLLSEEDYKSGFKMIEYLKYKADKKLRKQAIEDVKMKQQHEKEIQEGQAAIEAAKIKAGLDGKQIEAKGFTDAARINNEAKLQVNDSKIQNQPIHQQQKTQDQMELETHKKNLQEQEAF